MVDVQLFRTSYCTEQPSPIMLVVLKIVWTKHIDMDIRFILSKWKTRKFVRNCELGVDVFLQVHGLFHLRKFTYVVMISYMLLQCTYIFIHNIEAVRLPIIQLVSALCYNVELSNHVSYAKQLCWPISVMPNFK